SLDEAARRVGAPPLRRQLRKKWKTGQGNGTTFALARMRGNQADLFFRRRYRTCAELRETEIDALIHKGLLKTETRNDVNAVLEALYEHLERTLDARP